MFSIGTLSLYTMIDLTKNIPLKLGYECSRSLIEKIKQAYRRHSLQKTQIPAFWSKHIEIGLFFTEANFIPCVIFSTKTWHSWVDITNLNLFYGIIIMFEIYIPHVCNLYSTEKSNSSQLKLRSPVNSCSANGLDQITYVYICLLSTLKCQYQ